MARIFSSTFIKLICLIGIWAFSQAIFISQSWAQSRVCRQLEQKLSQVSTGNFGAPSRRYQQYENAIQEQRAQMSITQRVARRNGCNRSQASGGRCARLNSSLRQMKANLDKLQRTRNRLRPARGNAGAERRNILRTMQRRGCMDRRTEPREANVRRERPKRRTLMEQIFGRRSSFREFGGRIQDDPEEFSDQGRFNRGTFRTMCVRSCDGYYFPISFSTTQDKFEEDAETCQNMCPGSEVQLFFHGMPNQSPEQMISYRTDIAYAEEPYAFAYRKKINPECSCNFSQVKSTDIPGLDTSELEGLEDLGVPEDESKSERIGLPIFRQDRFLNPEAQDNSLGSFTMADLRRLGAPATPKNADKIVNNGKNKRIRIVGPAFFPVQ